MFKLNGRTAVVTGSGSGIGKAVAEALAARGARLELVDSRPETVQITAASIAESGGEARVHSCDVSLQQDVVAVFGAIGRVDILVNCAGVSHIGRADTTTESDFDRLFNINVKGTYNCMFAAIPLMKGTGGAIINVSSIAAHVGIPDRFAYSMTKGAVSAMTLSVAKDYLTDGIRCNSISPARVHTPFVDDFIARTYPGQETEMFGKLSATQPIGRMAKPVEVAALIVYLASDEAAFLTGCDYPIDGGFIKLNN